MSETQYVVLLSKSGYAEGSLWMVIGHSIASGANTAKRRAVTEFKKENPDYDFEDSVCVAVPLSSWHPEPVELEVQTRLKIG